MNGTGCVALTETTRDELRTRIGLARDRFDRLIRTADPHARPPGSDWTVQQVAAHVLTVAHRYRQVARGQEFRRAATIAEMPMINQAELEAVMAPVATLADQLRATEAEIDAMFDQPLNDRPEILFHGGILVSDITAQTNWLGELLIHGLDIARAVKASWDLPERDMLLILRGAMQITPAALRSDVPRDTKISVAIKLPDARPYVIQVRNGTAEARELRPTDRPDAVLRSPASGMVQMLYQRMGPAAAVRNGLRIVGGRRPWNALKFQSYFETG